MSFFDDRIANVSESSVRQQIIGLAQGAGLKISNWRIIGVSVQMLETVVGMVYTAVNVIPAYVRGFASLDTSTDPGDEDPYDPNNVSMEPAPGLLSVYGANTYGTKRQGADYATGIATFVNAGPSVRTLAPEGLIYTWTGGTPPAPSPTYTNPADPSVYTNADGTLTVGVGVSVNIPIRAQIRGSVASAPANTLSLTTTLIGCTGTNPTAVLGSDREAADTYRAKCRQAPARLSLAGPGDAYAYLATKNLDGTVLMNAAVPPAPVGITRVQVTEDSATGIVNVYYGAASGPAISPDVTAANANIRLQAIAVPGAITFSGSAAIAVSVHVAGTARIRARTGITPAIVAAAIVAKLAEQFRKIPIGGVDQVSGAGVVYRSDIQGYARDGFEGIYDVELTLPASNVALAVGRMAVLNSTAGDGLGSGDWVITVVSP